MKESKEGKLRKENFLDAISNEDAAQILKILYAQDVKMARRIKHVIHEYSSDIDVGQIAKDIYSSLDRLDVAELSQRSGSTPHGYIEPGEMAYEIFAEVVEPFWARMKKYQKLAKLKEAKLYCVGILKGIYRYEKESRSQFKDWIGDGVSEHFYWICEEYAVCKFFLSSSF